MRRRQLNSSSESVATDCPCNQINLKKCRTNVARRSLSCQPIEKMSPKRRRTSDGAASLLHLKALELVIRRHEPRVLVLAHVTQRITELLMDCPKGSLEKATQAKLPNMVRWFAVQAREERRRSGKSAPRAFLEARLLTGVFESAKIGSVKLIQAWFTYLPDAQDLATPKIFEVAAREGHVHLLQWLLDENRLQDELMISSAPITHASVVEWLQEQFPKFKLTVSLDKMVERWTGPEALAFMQTVWRNKTQFKKIEVTLYAKSMAAARGDWDMLTWLDTIRKGSCHVWAVKLAAESGHVETFRWLMENVYSERVVTDPEKTFKWVDEVLMKATRRGHLEIVKLLRHKHCNRLAYVAAEEGHLELLKWLFGMGDKCDSGAVDQAAKNGHLEIIKWLHKQGITAEPNALDRAAAGGQLHVIRWLHDQGIPCTTAAMNDAARGNRLDIVRWLHANRSEGCTPMTMDVAASNGCMDSVIWLHENRTEGCTSRAMEGAASHGHLNVVQWLHENRPQIYATHTMCKAASGGHFFIMQWLHDHGVKGCECRMMNSAVQVGNLNMAQWLFAIYSQPPTSWAFGTAVRRGHLKVVQWLIASGQQEIHRGHVRDAIDGGQLEMLKWLDETFHDHVLSGVRFYPSDSLARLYADPCRSDIVEWLLMIFPDEVLVPEATESVCGRMQYPRWPDEVVAAKRHPKRTWWW